MVTRTVRRAFSGLSSAYASTRKGKRGAADTLQSAQERADEAWKRTTHGLHSAGVRKDPKA